MLGMSYGWIKADSIRMFAPYFAAQECAAETERGLKQHSLSPDLTA